MAKYVSPEGLDDALKAVATTIGSLSTRISTNAQGLQTLSSEIPTKVSQLQNDSGYTTNKGTVTGVKINGTTKSPSSGVVDLGTVITAHQDISGKVDKVDGKGLSTNDFTTTLKNKLNGIASGAEVNQNAFSNIAIGDTMLAADSKTDLLTIAAGDNITLTPDTSATKVTISASVPTLSSLMGSSAIGGTSSYIYWNGSKWATKSLGTLAFSSATSFPASDVYSWAKASTKPSYTKSEVGLGNVTNDAQVKRSEMGVASGVATLDASGLVPTSQLPSYVDDVLEYSAKSNFPTTGATGKIYVDTSTNKTYRWGGSAYVEISASLALGTTSSTAYRGDLGTQNATNISTLQSSVSTLQGYFDSTAAKLAKQTLYSLTIGSKTFNGSSAIKITKSDLELGNVENKSSATIRSEITKANVTSALGTGTGTTKYLREDGSWATPPDTNTNTTYSFSGGTNQFTVTPSNGSALTVTITPSISNNVTYSGTLTSGQVAVLDGTSGKIKASGYTIAKSVPSDAKFTDTTYSYVAPKQDGSEYGLTASGEKYEWNQKQNAISDLTTIRSNATNGATAYSWGNHASAGYCTKSQIENGVFPNMRVGLADDLGDIEETLDEEYTFQPTANPNEIRDGYAQIESLKGNSLVWNQLVVEETDRSINGVTLIVNKGRISLKGAPTIAAYEKLGESFRVIQGHKYLFYTQVQGTTQADSKTWQLYTDGVFARYKIDNLFIEANSSGVQSLRVAVYGDEIDCSFYLVVHDLTQMFGKGNEPETVEEFERRCPKGMPMDYNEGEVIHFNGDAVKSVGFNQWDEEWENGNIVYATGANSVSTSGIRSKNYIPMLPNTVYYIRSSYQDGDTHCRCAFFDENKVYLGQNNDGWKTFRDGTITTAPTVHYMRFCVNSNTYNNDICINISDPDKNGTYEPYTEFRRDLPTELFEGGMKSAGTAYDEIYFDKSKGKYIKVTRIGKVDWETVNIAYSQDATRFQISSINKLQGHSNIIASIYTNSLSPVVGSKIDKTISGYIENRNIYINDYDYTNIDTYRAAMIERGIEIYYELAEPIVEEIDIPYMDYQVSNSGTEEIVSVVPTTPIKARVTYNFDTIGTVRQNRFDISALKVDLKSNYQPLATAITQIKVNGTSIATSGIANIPIATSTADGAMSSTHVSKLSSVESAVSALSSEKLDKPSAWVTASLTLSGAAQHSSNPVKFRKCGSLLTIQGAFTFTYGSTSDGTAKLFKLPSGYIPAQSHSSWQYATGNWMWRLYIDTGGQAYIHSIVNPKTNAVNNSSSMTFLITVSFYID
jgi:hypothetical protein